MSRASAGPEGEPGSPIGAEGGSEPGSEEPKGDGPGGEEPLVIVRGSGNVFADLGLPNPEELQLKSSLAIEVNEAIKTRGLSRRRVGTLLRLTGPEVTRLLRYRLNEISVGQLVVFLARLGHDVEVVVRPRPEPHDGRRAGQVSVRGLR